MTEFLETAMAWLLNVGESYGVNPVLFAGLYLVSIPPYLMSIGWIVRNYRAGKPLHLPVFSTGFFFFLPATYLVAGGRNVPWLFYVIIGLLVVYGIYSTRRKINQRVKKEAGRNGLEV